AHSGPDRIGHRHRNRLEREREQIERRGAAGHLLERGQQAGKPFARLEGRGGNDFGGDRGRQEHPVLHGPVRGGKPALCTAGPLGRVCVPPRAGSYNGRMSGKPHAPACDRNRDPILAVLRECFADHRRVLEIGSGTGQHAVYFAAAMPWLTWQASDVEANLPGIRAWLDDAGLANTPPPLVLDVLAPWPQVEADAVFTANTLHIMGWDGV